MSCWAMPCFAFTRRCRRTTTVGTGSFTTCPPGRCTISRAPPWMARPQTPNSCSTTRCRPRPGSRAPRADPPMHTEFWRNKRVLITGHTGFKGGCLSLWLSSVGAHVTGYALKPPSEPSLYELAHVDETVRSTTGDIRDLEHLQRMVETAAPEVIFHMAAQSVVLSSYEAPVDTYSTNVMGTVHVLEAIRRAGGRSTVVNVTTDKCYENKGWVWGYREDDRLGGHDPYSNSKACAELVAQAYRDSFFPLADLARHAVGLASARAGNVIGGGDWTPHPLIPAAGGALLRGESVVLRHPEATRPWPPVLARPGGYI